MKVLVTGGAGYIGSVLVRLLLNDGHRVRVIDRLQFGGESLVDLLEHDNFEFQRGDIRETSDVSSAVADIDAVLHLAAIVGDPACSKWSDDARTTNLDGSQMLFRQAADAGVKQFVFASTCSNYGKMEGSDYVDESSPLNPISLYAETKVAFEQFLKEESGSCASTSLRFSTVYGLSPRPRFDLTVNEFTRDVASGKELVIYGEQFWRPYCHVIDLARSMKCVLESDTAKVAGETFNVGNTKENYTKGMLVEELRKQFPEMTVSFVQKDEDPRDYRVDFTRIHETLGFEITKTVPQGIEQIRRSIQQGMFSDPYSQSYSNI